MKPCKLPHPQRGADRADLEMRVLVRENSRVGYGEDFGGRDFADSYGSRLPNLDANPGRSIPVPLLHVTHLGFIHVRVPPFD